MPTMPGKEGDLLLAAESIVASARVAYALLVGAPHRTRRVVDTTAADARRSADLRGDLVAGIAAGAAPERSLCALRRE
jgi:hypothetical protein